MPTTDRDLLALEPSLFRDLGFAGQRLVKGVASTSYVTLNFESQDVGLDAAGVEAGHVVLLAGTPYEVVERLGDSALSISRLRSRATDDAIPPTPAEGAETVITTFGPQIEIIHRQILRRAGIQPGTLPAPGEIGENAITNQDDLRYVVALGALFLIYSGVAAGQGDDSPAAQHAALYRDRFARERDRTVVTLDLDGDGEPDASRCLGAIQLNRR